MVIAHSFAGIDAGEWAAIVAAGVAFVALWFAKRSATSAGAAADAAGVQAEAARRQAEAAQRQAAATAELVRIESERAAREAAEIESRVGADMHLWSKVSDQGVVMVTLVNVGPAPAREVSVQRELGSPVGVWSVEKQPNNYWDVVLPREKLEFHASGGGWRGASGGIRVDWKDDRGRQHQFLGIDIPGTSGPGGPVPPPPS